MADLEKTVSIVFGGKNEITAPAVAAQQSIDDFTSAVNRNADSLKNAGTSLDIFTSGLSSIKSKIESVAEPFSKMADYVLKTDAALAVLASGSLVAATTAAGNFQNKTSEIYTLFDASPKEFQAYQQAILDYATTSDKSLEDINSAIYEAISAGVKWQDSIEFVTAAEKLSVGGRADLTATTNTLIGAMNAYGVSTKEAGSFSDVLFQTVKIGQTTIPELTQSLASVTSIASSAGVSFKEIGAAIAALTASGVPTAEAVTYVKGAIEEIIKPSAGAKEAAAALGIEFNSAALQGKGFSGVLQDVWEKTGGNVEEITKLFGNVRGLSAALVLGKDASGIYADALKAMEDAAGSTQEAYDKMGGAFENVNNRLLNNLKVTLIEAGTPLLEDWSKTATGLEDIFKAVRVGLADDAFQPIYDALSSFSSTFGEYLGKIAAALPEAMQQLDFDGLIASMGDLGSAAKSAFEAFFGALDLTKLDDLAEAMQKVVDVVTAVINISSSMLETAVPVFKQIADAVQELAKSDQGSAFFGQLLAAGKLVEEMGVWLVTALVSLHDNTQDVIGVMESLAGSVKIAWNAIQIAIDASTEAVLKDIQSIAETVSGMAKAVGLPDDFTAGIDGFVSRVSQYRADLKADMDTQVQDWKDGWQMMSDGLGDAGGKAQTEIGKITAAMGGIPQVKTFKIDADTGNCQESIGAVSGSLATLGEKKTALEIVLETQGVTSSIGTVSELMNDIPRTYSTDFEMTGVDSTVGAAMTKMNDIPRTYSSDFEITDQSVETAKAKVNGMTFDQKMIEIETKGDIETKLAQIKADAASVQSAMEWTAKVNIADAQASADKIKAAFSSVTDTLTSTTDEIGKLFENTPDSSKSFGASQWKTAIEQATSLQQKEYELQKSLIEAQVSLINQKKAAMQNGDGLIKIDSSGLEPELEEIMWKIIEKVQVKASESASDFLLGIN